jgi:phosphatidylinositol-3-phosphatase
MRGIAGMTVSRATGNASARAWHGYRHHRSRRGFAAAFRISRDSAHASLFGLFARVHLPLGIALTAGALATSGPAAATEAALPRPDHTVIVIFENRSLSEINRTTAPFIWSLASRGALFTNSFAVTRPSQPNYFALFSGSTQGVRDDAAHRIAKPTLVGSLREKHLTFLGYAERGSPRQHNPWESFAGAENVERDFSQFPSDFSRLPTVSFVIPDLDHDMHNGTVAQGDTWLRRNLGAYAAWCARSNDLLILTFDEENHRKALRSWRRFKPKFVVDEARRILTVFFGGRVEPGRYDERINQYDVLRTIEAMYGLRPLGDVSAGRPLHVFEQAVQANSGSAASGALATHRQSLERGKFIR